MNDTLSQILQRLGNPSHSSRVKGLKLLLKKSSDLELNEVDAKLLFEALFRLLWLTDTKYQAEIISEVAKFIFNIDEKIHSSVFLGFWEILNKNWSGIDRFRLNKFYFFVDKLMSLLYSEEERNIYRIQSISDLFFNQNARALSKGLQLHIAELFVSHFSELPIDHSQSINFFYAKILIEVIVHCPSTSIYCDEACSIVCQKASRKIFENDKDKLFNFISEHLRISKLNSSSRLKLSKVLSYLQ